MTPWTEQLAELVLALAQDEAALINRANAEAQIFRGRRLPRCDGSDSDWRLPPYSLDGRVPAVYQPPPRRVPTPRHGLLQTLLVVALVEDLGTMHARCMRGLEHLATVEAAYELPRPGS